MMRIFPWLLLSGLLSCQSTPSPVQAPRAADEHPRGRVLVSLGGGSLSHQTADRVLDDDASAGVGRMQFELTGRHLGGGVDFEYGSADGMHDSPSSSGADVDWFDFYPHFTARILGGSQFRMPIRIGPYIGQVSLDDATSKLSHFTFGGRIEFEPEVDLVRTDTFDMRLFAGLGLGAGVTTVDTDGLFVSQDYDTMGSMLRAEVGARFEFSSLSLGLSYLHREWSFDESDPIGFSVIKEMDYEFDGFVLTAGAVW